MELFHYTLSGRDLLKIQTEVADAPDPYPRVIHKKHFSVHTERAVQASAACVIKINCKRMLQAVSQSFHNKWI